MKNYQLSGKIDYEVDGYKDLLSRVEPVYINFSAHDEDEAKLTALSVLQEHVRQLKTRIEVVSIEKVEAELLEIEIVNQVILNLEDMK